MTSRLASVCTAFFASLIVGCADKTKTFDVRVEVARVRPVARDADQAVLAIDVELRFPECPGSAMTVIRGDRAFAECVQTLHVGQAVPATIVWHRRGDRHVDDIVQLGGCRRVPDPRDDAWVEVVQRCEDLVENGMVVGVHCDRRRSKPLLERCPWFQR
jgi:hypothetical protein